VGNFEKFRKASPMPRISSGMWAALREVVFWGGREGRVERRRRRGKRVRRRRRRVRLVVSWMVDEGVGGGGFEIVGWRRGWVWGLEVRVSLLLRLWGFGCVKWILLVFEVKVER